MYSKSPIIVLNEEHIKKNFKDPLVTAAKDICSDLLEKVTCFDSKAAKFILDLASCTEQIGGTSGVAMLHRAFVNTSKFYAKLFKEDKVTTEEYRKLCENLDVYFEKIKKRIEYINYKYSLAHETAQDILCIINKAVSSDPMDKMYGEADIAKCLGNEKSVFTLDVTLDSYICMYSSFSSGIDILSKGVLKRLNLPNKEKYIKVISEGKIQDEVKEYLMSTSKKVLLYLVEGTYILELTKKEQGFYLRVYEGNIMVEITKNSIEEIIAEIEKEKPLDSLSKFKGIVSQLNNYLV